MKKLSRKLLAFFLTALILSSTFSCCFTYAAENTAEETTSNNVFILGEKDSLKAPDTINCSHLCHNDSKIAKFFYELFCFIWKLFNINQYCICGMSHYGLDSIILDSDNDGFPDCITNNDYTTDTDGDGLSDYQELMYCATEPLIADTDGDGVNDLNSDTDGDTLSNKYELSIGTHPAYSDTDNDELNDNKELTIGTNPLISDTDEDGATDGWEITNGFDPLTFNDTFSIKGESYESTDNTVTASVYMNVNGEQTDTLTVTTIDSANNAFISENIPGYIGNGYDFSIEGTFEEATLEFTYDTTVGEVGEDFQPRIYYLNEETGTFEELSAQTVENGKVTAVTTHFSTYILLNKVEFDKVWNNEIKSPIVDAEGKQSGIDVVFTIDVSGSMRWGRLSTAKTALTTFLNALGENDRAALVKFNTASAIISSLSSDINSVKSNVSGLSASGQTSMYKGLDTAINLLTDSSENYGYKMIVILSDGKDEPSTNYNSYYRSLVNEAIANDIIIYTVGAGSSVDTSILTQVATNTGGSYYAATETSGITDAFEYIQSNTVDVTTDSNQDGIPDYYAELIKNGEMLLGNGSAELKGIDLNESDDIDGDGLKNGEEIIVVENNEKVYLKYKSSPIMRDTDCDGIYDCKDSEPLKIGLKNGIIGTVKLFSNKNASNDPGGHSFITFTSYVYTNINIQAYNYQNSCYTVAPNSCLTFGLTQSAETASSSSNNNEKQRSGFSVNAEIRNEQKYQQENGSGNYYSGRVSISREVTQEQLNIILQYFADNNYYRLINHNCATVATAAWNKAFDENFVCRNALGLDTPARLKEDISLRSNHIVNDVFEHYIDIHCETCK